MGGYEGKAWRLLTVSPVGSAAAVWPRSESVTDHVYSGLLTLPWSSATGPGNPHHLQV